MIIPIKKINDRVEIAKQDADTTLFMNLMYAGEQMLKLIACAMVSGLTDNKGNKENDKYSHLYKLVHADSIGNWSQTLDSVLTGSASHYLHSDFKPFWSELTDKVTNPSWQYGALVSLNTCVKSLSDSQEDIPTKSQLKNWFNLFVRLRNDARAHGILNADQTSKICVNLETSINLIAENFSLFKIPWIFIKQNISGSYRITNLSDIELNPEIASKIKDLVFQDGVYLYLSEPFQLEILESNPEAGDFYLPNGNFTDKSYECISYISGRKMYTDSTLYLRPPGQLPSSETEGLGKLDLIRNTFTNLPNLQNIYINRKTLEEELVNVLSMEDRYPIITLSGRGGIGKTSLALHVLHELCNTKRFTAIVWLSARDIDLLDEGPKVVKPQILTEHDIATEFAKLFEPEGFKTKGFDSKKYMESELKESSVKSVGSILFVMDNFETLKNPKQVYSWLDTYVRNPNKVLITSRLRDFKADYPITVEGMNRDEFNELVEKVSVKLEIHHLLNKSFLDELYRESDGHPYVVKVMLGEVSKQRELRNVKRIIASKDEILTALFERTYSDLSPSAKRVFLTLSSWRNILPEIAIEAVLNREENEHIKVEDAIEELHRYSFIELIRSNLDDSTFISVPLAAFEFGRKKLSVSPLKSKIQLDIELLNHFGVTQFIDINKGLKPKAEQFFKNIAVLVRSKKEKLNTYIPIIHFICTKYPYGWVMLYSIYNELSDLPKAIEALQNFVSDHRITGKRKIFAWELLSKLYSLQKDYTAEAQTLVDICNIDDIEFNDLSNSVDSLLNLFKEKRTKFKKEEIFLLLNSVADKMNIRLDNEGVISDFTKLAWVYIYLDKKERAKSLTEAALKRDPNYFHALNLKRILKQRKTYTFK